MGERSVLASFYSDEEAQKAAKQIKDLGIEVAQVDQLHGYSGFSPKRDSFTISGEIPSLASITLDTTVSSRETGILLAADSAASGLAEGAENISGRNFLLTVVCPENQVEQVVDIIKACNGYT